MKVLQTIKSSLIVGVDIETVRVAENFKDLDKGFQDAWRYKNKQNGIVPTEEELEESWVRTSSLYAEFSKICAISLAYLNQQGNLVCKEYFGENEKAILEAVAITLNNMQAYNPQYRLVGHASKYFDYPFTSKRYIINQLEIPQCLDSTNLKPWEGMNLCTNDLWKCGGTGAGSSLQALCNVLNVPISKVDLVGDEVGTAFYKREFSRIGRYCSLDSVATFNVFRRFKKESIFEFKDVEYIVAYSEEEKVEEVIVELPLLQKIYSSGNLSEEVKKELSLKVSKPTEEDRQNLIKILTAHYQQKGDKVAIKKEKEKEVTEFINSLC